MNIKSTRRIDTDFVRLLDYGDELLEDAAFSSEHPSANYSALMLLDGTASADGGGRMQISFTKIHFHASLAVALEHVFYHPQELIMRSATDLQLTPQGGSAVDYYSAVIHSVTTAMSKDLPAATETTYQLSCSPVVPGTVGSNLTINPPPTCSITVPSEGASYAGPVDITITATASDTGGSIARVDFYSGSLKIGEQTVAPYTMLWTGVASGAYQLTAIATDNLGARTTSTVRNITVTGAANVLPSVVLVSPTAGADFPGPARIFLAASASDSDGSIVLVEFYNGTSKLGSDPLTPFTFSWVGVPAGSYALKAKATDNLGGVTWSVAVNVTVTAVPPRALASITDRFDAITTPFANL